VLYHGASLPARLPYVTRVVRDRSQPENQFVDNASRRELCDAAIKTQASRSRRPGPKPSSRRRARDVAAVGFRRRVHTELCRDRRRLLRPSGVVLLERLPERAHPFTGSLFLGELPHLHFGKIALDRLGDKGLAGSIARADCRAAIHHSPKASRQWTQWPALAPPRLLLRLLNQPIERVPQFQGEGPAP
jgi:hypothetical protein